MSPIVPVFVQRWQDSQLRERAAAQSHFIELCQLIGHKTPAEQDVAGDEFTFEKNVIKANGKPGWADVWYKGKFAWEYKGKNKSLDDAYAQLQAYRGDLGNPPLLVVCDFEEYRIYPQWPDMDGRPFILKNADLLQPRYLKWIRWLFDDPDAFKRERDEEQHERSKLTERLAKDFAQLSQWMREFKDAEGKPVWSPLQIAHFLTRIVFVLFAQNIGLLPKHDGNPMFTYLVDRARREPDKFAARLKQLFSAMNGDSNEFLLEPIPYFNGGLFAEAEVLDLMQLRTEGVQLTLEKVCAADWSQVNPTIVGTLFERALDESKRAQLGAHYTSEADIRLIVDPVLMQPLYREWADVRAEAEPLLQRFLAADATPNARYALKTQLTALYERMVTRLGTIRVLDPACGSGNFLYVGLRALKDLESQVRAVFSPLELPFREVVTPRQMFGLEKDEFAAQLARVVVWIGNLQWRFEATGKLTPVDRAAQKAEEVSTPILKDRDENEPEHIMNADSILRYDADGKPYEPQWPNAEVIIGNPPFLGGKRMRSELKDAYVNALFGVYAERVPHEADLVCYWFEKARAQIESGKASRAGLLATNSIRGGANRTVLERIKETGDIFMAWGDRPWLLEGAAVRVSMVGFDNKAEAEKLLNGVGVISINADLTTNVDLTPAKTLAENHGIAFQGPVKVGAFDIPDNIAQPMLNAVNVSGCHNSDVVRPYMNGDDIVGRTRNYWLIDFGLRSEAEATQYALPFQYVEQHIKPTRIKNNDRQRRENWWRLGRSGEDYKEAVANRNRQIFTPRVSKHRIFIWISSEVMPSDALIAIARSDDYFFGVLHSYLHECWSLRMGTWLGVGNDPRYTPTTTFETFPFPWSPGKEPVMPGAKAAGLNQGEGDGERIDPGFSPGLQAGGDLSAIAATAKALHETRDAWLNPSEPISPGQLTKRTLTNLYNAVEEFRTAQREGKPYLTQESKPASKIAKQIAELHDALDRAVLAAYGWGDLADKLRTPAGDEELLRRLLKLNLERAG